MVHALVMDFPGGTREQYDQVMERMALGGQMPAGGLAHLAGSYDGGWRVIDVWEDMGAFERFRDTQIGPHTQAVGLAPPNVRVVQAGELMRGEGEVETFAQVVIISGMNAERFAEMDRQILPDGNRPPEVVWHVHGPLGDDWVVIDTWTSRAARDAFVQGTVMPAMQAAGVAGPPAIEELDVETGMGVGAPTPAAA